METDRRRLLLFRKLYPLLQWLPGIVLLRSLDRQVLFANRYLRERFGDPGDRPLRDVLFEERAARPDRDPAEEPEGDALREWEGTLADGRTYRLCALPFTEEDGSSLVLVLGVGLSGPGRAEGSEVRSTGGPIDFLEALSRRGGASRRAQAPEPGHARREELAGKRRAVVEWIRDLIARNEELDLSLRMGRSQLLRTQRALVEARRRFHLVGELFPYGVWSCGSGGDLRHVSRSFLDLLGMTFPELRECWEGSRPPPPFAGRFLDAFRKAVAGEEPFAFERRIGGPDGRRRAVLVRGEPVHDEAGRAAGWAGVILDAGDSGARKGRGVRVTEGRKGPRSA